MAGSQTNRNIDKNPLCAINELLDGFYAVIDGKLRTARIVQPYPEPARPAAVDTDIFHYALPVAMGIIETCSAGRQQ